MKKFLLVTFIGVALAINLYAIVTGVIKHYESKDLNSFSTTSYVEVYVE